MSAQLAQTPLHAWHVAQGGRMVDFAGWSMPVMYSTIVTEHTATRETLGLFDISHMGRLRFDGPDAPKLLDSLNTRSVLDMPVGAVRYGLITNEVGGILDDVLTYHLRDGSGVSYYLLVVNASNREKIVGWIDSHRQRFQQGGFDCTVTDLTTQWGMIAVQGPKALEVVAPLVEAPLSEMKYYTAAECLIGGHGGIASRTGYTGEDGCELIVGEAMLPQLWEEIMQRGEPLGAMAAGLGCRDTLRLEAAMPLYGHELSEQIDPFQAGLKFAVNLEGRAFLGHDALVKKSTTPPDLKRVGLKINSRRVPREGYPVLSEAGERVGAVSSGTFSPTLQIPIAMAYVPQDQAKVGTALQVEIRGRGEPAEVVKLPFYRRAKS